MLASRRANRTWMREMPSLAAISDVVKPSCCNSRTSSVVTSLELIALPPPHPLRFGRGPRVARVDSVEDVAVVPVAGILAPAVCYAVAVTGTLRAGTHSTSTGQVRVVFSLLEPFRVAPPKPLVASDLLRAGAQRHHVVFRIDVRAWATMSSVGVDVSAALAPELQL